jgi:hypothetical protein
MSQTKRSNQKELSPLTPDGSEAIFWPWAVRSWTRERAGYTDGERLA